MDIFELKTILVSNFSYHNIMDKIYKVGIITPGPPITYKIKDNYEGRSIEIWKLIKKELEKKKYIFKETYLKNDTYNEAINKCSEGIYDIVIGDFSVTSLRREKVLFTLPIYLYLPSVLIKEMDNKKTHFHYFNFLIKNIYKPIIIFSIFSIIPFIILNIFDGNKKKLYIYYILAGFYHQSRSLLHEGRNFLQMIIISIIIIIIFTFYIFLYSLINAKTILYKNDAVFKKNYLINKKIIVYKGTVEVYSVIKGGMIPVEISTNTDKYNYFLKNMDKVDGIYYSIGSYFIQKQKNKMAYLIESDYKSGITMISFPINKKNKNLQEEINKYIVYLQYGSNLKKIYKLCKKYDYSNPELCNFT